MEQPEEPTGEERSEIEREHEDPEKGDPEEAVQPVKDESDPWAKLSTGRDPDE